MFNFQPNSQGQLEAQFQAKLVNVGTTVLQNSNGKNYKVVTIEFANNDGVVVQRSAMCYEGNYQNGIQVGDSYLTTVRIDATGKPQLQMSHLTQASRATIDDFGIPSDVSNAVPASTVTNPLGYVQA